VLVAARALGVAPREMLVVGDFVFDIEAGKAAGSPTVLLTNGRKASQPWTPQAQSTEPDADYIISTLGELAGIVGI
jgi:phosphoglycolate phosphatase-like HAD superfamily hydrolase